MWFYVCSIRNSLILNTKKYRDIDVSMHAWYLWKLEILSKLSNIKCFSSTFLKSLELPWEDPFLEFPLEEHDLKALQNCKTYESWNTWETWGIDNLAKIADLTKCWIYLQFPTSWKAWDSWETWEPWNLGNSLESSEPWEPSGTRGSLEPYRTLRSLGTL